MIELQTLGATDLKGIPVSAARTILAQPRRFALLAYLALARPYGFHRRDSLLALFWADSDEARARLALRQALHHIRRSLGAGVLVSRGSDELGLDESRIRCDAREFDRAISSGDLERALGLYRGDLLPGLFVSDAAGLESWLSGERLRQRDRACSGASSLAAAAEAANDLSRAVVFARRAVEINPQDEGVLRGAMAVFDRAGDRTGALSAYDLFAGRLAAEWDDSPSPESAALAELIRSGRRPPAISLPFAEPLLENSDRQALPAIPDSGGDSGSAASATAPSSVEDKRLKPGLLGAISSKRWWLAVAVATLLAIGWVGGRAIGGEAGARAIGGENRSERIIIFPFAVRSAPAWAYLGEGMVDLLGAKLDGAGRFRVADARAVLALTRRAGSAGDPVQSRELARQLGGRWFVLGTVFADSSGIQLRATLFDVESGRAVSRAASEGRPKELFRLVDDLTLNLLQGIQGGPADDLNRLAMHTTGSLTALKDYLQGEADFRSGDFDRSVRGFQRATDRDSTFALADYRLAVASDFAGAEGSFILFHARRAQRHSARLGEGPRMLIQAFVALNERREPDAREMYGRIVAVEPDNVEAWYQLADMQFHDGPHAGHPSGESRGTFERVLKYDPENASALIHLARLAAMDERWADLDSLTRRVLARVPRGDHAVEMLAVRGVILRDDSALTAAIDSLRESTASRRLVTARRATASARNPARAAVFFRLLVNPSLPPDFRAHGYLGLADIEAARGRWRVARSHLSDARQLNRDLALERAISFASSNLIPFSSADIDPWKVSKVPGLEDVKSVYALGVFEARNGMRGPAISRLVQLERWGRGSSEYAAAAGAAMTLRAHISLRDDSIGALVRAETERGVSPNAVTHEGTGSNADRAFLHAELLRQVGRDTEALVWYRIAAEDEYGGIVYLASSSWRSAEILDRLGRQSDALVHFERVVDLWSLADAELQPHVSKARLRVARIRAASAGASGR